MEIAEERACFTHILQVSLPSFIRALTTRSRENKVAITTENESEKSSTNIMTYCSKPLFRSLSDIVLVFQMHVVALMPIAKGHYFM